MAANGGNSSGKMLRLNLRTIAEKASAERLGAFEPDDVAASLERSGEASA